MNEMEIKFSSAVEIAQMLINNEVKLSELMSIVAFAEKADITQDAVWELCKKDKMFSRYLEIYPNGKHKSEASGYSSCQSPFCCYFAEDSLIA